MQLFTEKAINAVSEALSKLNVEDDEERYQPSLCYDDDDDDDRVEDLVLELTWLKCFLLDGQTTPQGLRRTDIWSRTIARLAQSAVNLLDSGWVELGITNPLGIEELANKLSNLREKLQPFVTTPPGDSSPAVPKLPDGLVRAVKVSKKTKVRVPKIIEVTAWGGPAGRKWDYKFEGSLKQITIVNGEVIDSLSFVSLKPDGSLKTLKVGGKGGYNKTQVTYTSSYFFSAMLYVVSRRTYVQVNINGTTEWLTGFSGMYGFYFGMAVIRSITFQTNLKKYGPYGSSGSGAPFHYRAEKGGKIVGLHGRCGGFVDAIGVYYLR